MTAGGASIEVVRGALSDERANEVLSFWAGHGALEGEAARERLKEVICVARGDDGEIVGVNSAHAEEVSPVGRRLWRYRSFLPGAGDEVVAAMFKAAFAALGEGFDPDAPGTVGVCVTVTDRDEMERRPEAVWPAEELVFAGYRDDGSQLRIRYFWNAKIGPGPDDSPPLEATMGEAYAVGDDYQVLPIDESTVTPDDVLELWARETGIPEADARQRVHQVHLIAVNRKDELAGISTAYIQRNAQLGMDFWHYRTYVAVADRHSNLAAHLALAVRDRLEELFVSGEDTRAAGIVMEIENPGLRTYFNRALWLPLNFTFIGDAPSGAHVRVHFFPGARVPLPS